MLTILYNSFIHFINYTSTPFYVFDKGNRIFGYSALIKIYIQLFSTVVSLVYNDLKIKK